jgi:hypothetical protein
MHIDQFVRGKGRFMLTGYVPTDEKVNNRFPLLLTTGRILSQYNVGAQTRRTDNVAWHAEDRLEIHPSDAESRGIATATGSAWPAAPGRPCCAPGSARVAGRGVHHLPLPRVRRQRDHHRQLRLGHQLPRVQGDRSGGGEGVPAVGMAEALPELQ